MDDSVQTGTTNNLVVCQRCRWPIICIYTLGLLLKVSNEMGGHYVSSSVMVILISSGRAWVRSSRGGYDKIECGDHLGNWNHLWCIQVDAWYCWRQSQSHLSSRTGRCSMQDGTRPSEYCWLAVGDCGRKAEIPQEGMELVSHLVELQHNFEHGSMFLLLLLSARNSAVWAIIDIPWF